MVATKSSTVVGSVQRFQRRESFRDRIDITSALLVELTLALLQLHV